MLAASSGSTSSSASKLKIHSPDAFSSAEFFCAAYPFHSSTKTFAPSDSAISTVRSVDPESTTMISPFPSRTSGITLSSVRPRLASSLYVMMTTESVTPRAYSKLSSFHSFKVPRASALSSPAPHRFFVLLREPSCPSWFMFFLALRPSIARRRRRHRRRQVLPRSNIRHIRCMGHLAANRIGHHDAGMVQQQTRRAVQFDHRFFIRRRRRNQVRLGAGQSRLGLQYRGRSRNARRQLLLLRVQRLPCQFDRGLCRLHRRAILLQRELRIAHLDAHLVLQLL